MRLIYTDFVFPTNSIVYEQEVHTRGSWAKPALVFFLDIRETATKSATSHLNLWMNNCLQKTLGDRSRSFLANTLQTI